MSRATNYLIDQIEQKDHTISSLMRSQAAVWHEGWEALRAEQEAQKADPSHPITRRNPYDRGAPTTGAE